MNTGFVRPVVATALTVYGIETKPYTCSTKPNYQRVATALTVYGIETEGFEPSKL